MWIMSNQHVVGGQYDLENKNEDQWLLDLGQRTQKTGKAFYVEFA